MEQSLESRRSKYCFQRMPLGAASSQQFGVALVQEVDQVHDLEPLFYADFDRYCSEIEGNPTLNSAIPKQESRSTTSLISPEFTFRLLRLLRLKGVVTYDVPHISPLIELDETIIDQCKDEVSQEQRRKFDATTTDDDDIDTTSVTDFDDRGGRKSFLSESASTESTRSQAKAI